MSRPPALEPSPFDATNLERKHNGQSLEAQHMVKNLLNRLGRPKRETSADSGNSEFFTTLFLERDEAGAELVPWPERGKQLGATPADRTQAEARLAELWANEQHSAAMGTTGLKRLGAYLSFVQVEADRELISQDEQGDYLLIILDGAVAVDRIQPWGGRARLGEARAGEILGEMSLLDAGTRFSACRTLKPCVLAVLDAKSLDRMVNEDSRLAAALMAALARRLSLRLRQASARLSALLAQN